MPWLQLRLDTHPQDVEPLEDLMLATGAVAVTMEDNADDPVLEPGVGETPLWGHIRLTGLYDAGADMQKVLAKFPAESIVKSNHRIEIMEDKDWEREWMQHYQPMKFSDQLWVCPSWIEPPDPKAINLLLDPGLAFGTGTHPTTSLCLSQIAQAPLADKLVVDYGCGSGILGVATLKLGAKQVLGIDNDPQALIASRENARRNNIADSALRLGLPGEVNLQPYASEVDLVIANILAGPLMELSDPLIHFLKPGGILLLSGLIEDQAEALISHYGDRISLTVAGRSDGWICLQGVLV
ncbi:MAG: 50S ribosomal protein L11 methyltransferase [Halioglobus sp.]